MDDYNDHRFHDQVNKALVSVKRILDNTRNPTFPADIPHKYEDKYTLSQYLTNISITSLLNCLEILGLDDKGLLKLRRWVVKENSSVTLALARVETCTFLRKEKRKETKTVSQTEIAKIAILKDKVVNKIIEYFWDFSYEYELFCYKGNNPTHKLILKKSSGKIELVTTADITPHPEKSEPSRIERNITWLLENINEDSDACFYIDKADKGCRTPRRNPHTEMACDFFDEILGFFREFQGYLSSHLFPLQTNHDLNMSLINDNEVFIPVVPLFENSSSKVSKNLKSKTDKQGLSRIASTLYDQNSPLPTPKDVNDYLLEHRRSLEEKFSVCEKVFPKEKIITPEETKVVITLMNARRICQHHLDGVNHIEHMLYTQLIQAIGKEVNSVDFVNYMKFHNRQLFKKRFQPTPFCYAIRRPEHYPEGTISIEAQLDDGSLANPIPTIVRSGIANKPMYFSLDAATKVAFYGDRNLHAWVNHEFSGDSGLSLNLCARARQFSCFILLVGRIISDELFEPSASIIIQNKDDLKIPLMLETIPTPKEFRDAIESLSPEQQRFAKAYRSMQLSSTLFGVCVIQIKPQLEKLLNLPYDSLTKEIKLTQNLLELFIKYQIPSDLLSYSGIEIADGPTRVRAVQGHVEAILDLIKQTQDAEIQQKILEEKMKNAVILSSAITEEVYIPQAKSYSKSKKGGMSFARNKNMKKKSTVSAKKAPQSDMDLRSCGLADGGFLVDFSSDRADAIVENVKSDVVDAPKPSSAPAGTEIYQVDKSTEKHSVELYNSEMDIDYTKLPTELDQNFDMFDDDSALRSTIINIGPTWHKECQKALLAPVTSETLSNDEQIKEKHQAFDLLDALTRSGILSVDYASLHVVLAATHTFDDNLMNTVIKDNINPIEKVERSVLIMASTIFGLPAKDLVDGSQVERVATYSPKLFPDIVIKTIENKKEEIGNKKVEITKKDEDEKIVMEKNEKNVEGMYILEQTNEEKVETSEKKKDEVPNKKKESEEATSSYDNSEQSKN